ncbi:hypothetical protein LCL85_14075 [Vibrio alginolyticus]|nr:hypothetical protein [Vibrio alginolyticus]
MFECIPSYPDFISTLESRDKLISAELLSPSTDEKIQLRTLQRCINQVIADQTSIEVQDGGRAYRYQIPKGYRHPIRPDGIPSLVSLQIIEK